MLKMNAAVLLLSLTISVSAKVFDRCRLAKLFLHKYKFPTNEIDDCE